MVSPPNSTHIDTAPQAQTVAPSLRVGAARTLREAHPYLLVLAQGFLVVAPLAALLIQYQYHLTYETWKARQSSLAEERSRIVTQWLQERRGDVQTLATRPEVIAALSRPGSAGARRREAKALTAVLETYAQSYHYLGAYAFDTAGQPAGETGGAQKLPEGLQAVYAVQAKEGGLRFEVVNLDGSTTLSISTPVFAEAASSLPQHCLGVVALLARLDRPLYPLLGWESVPTRTGETMLVRKDGDQVEYLSPPRDAQMGKAGMRRPYPSPGFAAQAALEGKETFGEFVDYRGERVLAATRRIPLTGWGLVSKIDRAEAFQGFLRLTGVEAFSGVLLLAALGGLVAVNRRRAERLAERREQERFRALVEAAAQIVWTANPLGEGQDCPSWKAFTGQTVEESIGWGWVKALHPADRERAAAVWSQAVKSRSLYSTEFRVRGRDGEYRHFTARGVPVLEDDGSIREWVGFLADIHERKRAEESARQLAGQLLRSQDQERRRMARDLHDSAGQALAALSIDLDRLRQSPRLGREDAALLENCRAQLEGLMQEIRTLSHLLHPPMLDDVGLSSALQWYVAGFEKRSGIATRLELAPDLKRLPADFEIAIFRIVQEALTNVHRHSGSATATVRLTRAGAGVRLEIADQGRGIPAEKRGSLATGAAMGVGIRGMRERVAQLGGILEIQSSDAGTIVSATLPLKEEGATP